MDVNKITKKFRLTPKDCVRYQLITSIMFFKKDMISASELDILVLLSLHDEVELSSFCIDTTKELYVIDKPEQFHIKSQNVRNIINKLTKKGFIIKNDNPSKKNIKINPDFDIQHKGNILLNYNFLSIA